MTSELRLETVLQRLVVEVTKLLDADAADCYLYDADRSLLRCAAVHGLDAGPRRVRVPGRSARSTRDSRSPLPHTAYQGFASAISAPMTWSGERRGVLGVATRDPERTLRRARAEPPRDLCAASRRLPCGMRRASSRASGRRASSAASDGIASALAEHLSQAATLDAVAHAANEALGGSFTAVLMPGARGLELAASYRVPDELAATLARRVPASADGPRDRRCERAAPALRVVARRRRPLRRGLAPARGRRARCWRIPVDPPRREEGGLVVVFFAEQRTFTRRRPRARPPARGSSAAAGLERSELYESERTSRALSQQLARMGEPPRDGARPGGDPRRGRRPGACPARRRRVRDPARRGRRARRQRGRRQDRAVRCSGSRVSDDAPVPAGDVVQSRVAGRFADAPKGSTAASRDDPVLAAGHAAVPGRAARRAREGLQGVLAVYSQRPRAWREEEVEALAALARNASRGALERRALPAGRDRAGTQLRDPLEHRRRDRRRRPRGQGRALERGGEAITGVPAAAALGRTPLEVLPARARVWTTRLRGRAAARRSSAAATRLALADRGRHARSGRRRSPAASSPSATFVRADRRADEVRPSSRPSRTSYERR